MAYRITLNTLLEADSTIVVLAFDTDRSAGGTGTDARGDSGQPPFTAAAYLRHGCPRSDGHAGKSFGVSFEVGTTDSTSFDALLPPREMSFTT